MATADKTAPKTKAIEVAAQPASTPAAKATAAKATAAKAATSKAPVAGKPPAKPAPKAAPKPVSAEAVKAKKPKLVRDGFTIPKSEYLVLNELKLRAVSLRHPSKKSELIRAGIKALAAMPDDQLLSMLKAVPAIKTGRPGKEG